MDTPDLMRLFGFTSRDLTYNQRAEESPDQQQNRNLIRIGLILFACVVAVGPIFTLSEPRNQAAVIFGIGIAVYVLYLSAVGYPSKIHRVTGVAMLRNNAGSYGGRAWTLQIGKRDFRVSREIYEAIPIGIELIAYYQERPRGEFKLLTVERLHTPEPDVAVDGRVPKRRRIYFTK